MNETWALVAFGLGFLATKAIIIVLLWRQHRRQGIR